MNYSELPDNFHVQFHVTGSTHALLWDFLYWPYSTATGALRRAPRQRHAGLLNKILSSNCGSVLCSSHPTANRQAIWKGTQPHAWAIESRLNILCQNKCRCKRNALHNVHIIHMHGRMWLKMVSYKNVKERRHKNWKERRKKERKKERNAKSRSM